MNHLMGAWRFYAGLAVLAACAPAAAPAASLSITPDGRFFAIDGRPVFLAGVSYFSATGISTPEFITHDLDDMVAQGFNWIRVWVFWQRNGSDNWSVMTPDGIVREPYLSRLKTIITECNRRGMIVDCTMHRDAKSNADPANQRQHLACARSLAKELLAYRNVYIDVANERDVQDKRFVSLSEVGELIGAIHEIDPARLCTASGVPASQEDLAGYRTTGKVDFIAPHLCRTKECPAQTAATVREFVGWMQALGFRIPVNLQEPLRRGYTEYNPTTDDLIRDCTGARIAEAAGWCLHNGGNRAAKDGRPFRSFRMDDREGRLYKQWDDIERAAASTLTEQTGGVNTRVRRYQAEYSEQISHAVGVRDGSAWTAWATGTERAAPGYLAKGPSFEAMPAGQQRAEWRLKIYENQGGDDLALTIDVVRANGMQVLASQQIRGHDFKEPNVYQVFALQFTSKADDRLVCRTYWHGTATVSMDWVTLTIDPAATNSVFPSTASRPAGDMTARNSKRTDANSPTRDPARTVHIAVVQAGENHYKDGNPGPLANYKLLAEQARQAAAAEPRPEIICFPEFAISGWPYPEEKEINQLAEPVPGEGVWYHRYQQLARETRAALLCWLVELDGDRRYNTACLIDANGEFRAKYRKVHTTLGEQGWWGWSKGARFTIVELDGVLYGISICADMWFPETVRSEELLGADVILHQSVGDDMGKIMPARAIDSKLPIVLSIFQGGAYAVNPNGDVIGKLPSATPGWKTFNIEPFHRHRGTKYAGLYDLRKADYNLRSPEAYSIMTDPSLRPPWTEVFLDKQGQPQSREQILKRFHGHYDADDAAAATAPAGSTTETKGRSGG